MKTFNWLSSVCLTIYYFKPNLFVLQINKIKAYLKIDFPNAMPRAPVSGAGALHCTCSTKLSTLKFSIITCFLLAQPTAGQINRVCIIMYSKERYLFIMIGRNTRLRLRGILVFAEELYHLIGVAFIFEIPYS